MATEQEIEQEINDLKAEIVHLNAQIKQYEAAFNNASTKDEMKSSLLATITSSRNNLNQLQIRLYYLQQQQQLAPPPPPAPGKIYIYPPTDPPFPLGRRPRAGRE